MSLATAVKRLFKRQPEKRAAKPIAPHRFDPAPGHGDKVSVDVAGQTVTATLFRRRESRILQCRFRFNGKVVRKSTHATTRAGARDGAACWIKHTARACAAGESSEASAKEGTPPRTTRELCLLNH